MWRAKARQQRSAREFVASPSVPVDSDMVPKQPARGKGRPRKDPSNEQGSSSQVDVPKKRGRPPKVKDNDTVANATSVKKTIATKKKSPVPKKSAVAPKNDTVTRKNTLAVKSSVAEKVYPVHPLILSGELNLDPLYALFNEMKDTIESLNNSMYFIKKDVRAICDSLHGIIQKGERHTCASSLALVCRLESSVCKF